MWPAFAVVSRVKPALAQGVIVRTNSRDITHQAKLSPACDGPATVEWRPYRRQLVGPSTTFSGGRLARVEEAGDLMRPRSKPTSSDSLRDDSLGIGWFRRKEHVSGNRDVPPPFLSNRRAAPVGPHT